ncbi:Uncharacterised protein [Candidatus Gugararchaeum adminiculabundum]|nr:Uncharacterised protein [Candidatus Gugararchaeum adminiculabundum]
MTQAVQKVFPIEKVKFHFARSLGKKIRTFNTAQALMYITSKGVFAAPASFIVKNHQDHPSPGEQGEIHRVYAPAAWADPCYTGTVVAFLIKPTDEHGIKRIPKSPAIEHYDKGDGVTYVFDGIPFDREELSRPCAHNPYFSLNPFRIDEQFNIILDNKGKPILQYDVTIKQERKRISRVVITPANVEAIHLGEVFKTGKLNPLSGLPEYPCYAHSPPEYILASSGIHCYPPDRDKTSFVGLVAVNLWLNRQFGTRHSVNVCHKPSNVWRLALLESPELIKK